MIPCDIAWQDISVTFDDVGGYANLLDDLKSEVVFSPSEYAENVSEGLTNSKILFHGPDGTGETQGNTKLTDP